MKPNPKSPPIEQRITPSQLDQNPAPKSNIYQLKLVGGRSSDSERLHHMRDGWDKRGESQFGYIYNDAVTKDSLNRAVEFFEKNK